MNREDLPSVGVVGGGAVGVTVAGDLAARGARVTLFERETLGAGSSGRAAGVVYDAFAEDIDAAIAARSLERFRSLSLSLPDVTFTSRPYVIAVREGDGDADAVPAMVDRMCGHGRDVSVVDPDALADRFSRTGLATADLAVAAVATGAGWADPASYVRAMATRARRRGVRIETGVTVALDPSDPARVRIADASDDRWTRERVSFDAVVVAAGAHTERLLATADVSVPVKPYRVQALVSRAPYDGPMVYDATAETYLRPHPAGLLAGDGAEPLATGPDEYDREADDSFVESIGETLRTRVGHDPVVERAWAGLCTATPDGDPIVGPIDGGPFVAAGWQGHGFMRAPAIGELVAEGVLATLSGVEPDDPDSPWVEAFDPSRFDGDESVVVREGITVGRADDPTE